jgi:hypothetical protein
VFRLRWRWEFNPILLRLADTERARGWDDGQAAAGFADLLLPVGRLLRRLDEEARAADDRAGVPENLRPPNWVVRLQRVASATPEDGLPVLCSFTAGLLVLAHDGDREGLVAELARLRRRGWWEPVAGWLWWFRDHVINPIHEPRSPSGNIPLTPVPGCNTFEEESLVEYRLNRVMCPELPAPSLTDWTAFRREMAPSRLSPTTAEDQPPETEETPETPPRTGEQAKATTDSPPPSDPEPEPPPSVPQAPAGEDHDSKPRRDEPGAGSGGGDEKPDRSPPPKQRVKPNRRDGPPTLRIVDGGFEVKDDFHGLAGRPRQMFDLLVSAHKQRMLASRLRDGMELEKAGVSFPDQVVKDTAAELRAILRSALGWGKGRRPNRAPLLSHGKGPDLTYHLDVRVER